MSIENKGRLSHVTTLLTFSFTCSKGIGAFPLTISVRQVLKMVEALGQSDAQEFPWYNDRLRTAYAPERETIFLGAFHVIVIMLADW
jgi:hypothetical protein